MIPDDDSGPLVTVRRSRSRWCSTRVEGRRWKRVSPCGCTGLHDLLSEGSSASRRLESFDDIPWEKINKDASDDLVLCGRRDVSAASDYLRTTVAGCITWVRNRFWQAWFQGELGLRGSRNTRSAAPNNLLRSGKRTERSDGRLSRPRSSTRSVGVTLRDAHCDYLYGVIQAMGHLVSYLKQRDERVTESARPLTDLLRIHRTRRDRALSLLTIRL